MFIILMSGCVAIIIISDLVIKYYYEKKSKKYKKEVEDFVNDVHKQEHVYFQLIDERLKKLENK